MNTNDFPEIPVGARVLVRGGYTGHVAVIRRDEFDDPIYVVELDGRGRLEYEADEVEAI
jgi:hypothetical protein